MTEPHIAAAPELVLARDAADVGDSWLLRSARERGALTRLRRGVYVDADALAAQSATLRYRTQVHAALAVRRRPIVAGLSAAALLGLPLIGAWPSEVYLLARDASGRRRNGVVEFARTRHDDEPITVDGVTMTSIPETLRHVCRTASFLTALVMVDAALRVDRYGSRPPLTTPDDIADVLERHRPFPGCARTERVFAFASPLADTPLETLSRVTIAELGFETPVLQHRLRLPLSGRDAWCDFAWPQHCIDGEADGWGKYVNPEYGSHVTAAQRVRLEKRRENEVRGIGWGCARWEWDDAWCRERLRAVLLEAGVPVVRRPRRLR